MTQTTRNILIGIVIVIIIALLGYFAWQERQTSASTPTTSTATSTAATSTAVSINVSNSGTTTAGYTITPITAVVAPTVPNYKTPLSYPTGTSADVQTQDQSQFTTIQTALAANPIDYSSWLGLGFLRMDTGDYSGAAADWKYVTEVYPNDPTAFADLGNLYATYLNEPSLGITNYKEAIKLDPTKEETFYQNLAQVYISEGDTADAKATLEQGISAQVVGYQNLQTMLNSMQ